jgi:hypothetical protein
MILEDVVTAEELAAFLGISTRSLARLDVPFIQLGTQRVYFKQTVVEWLKHREGTRT